MSDEIRSGGELTLRIEKPLAGGLGLARHGGFVVMVEGGVPGDLAVVRIEQRKRDFARGRVVQLVETGAGRRPPPCPHAARCGGCAYQGVEPEHQLAFKTAILRESLMRAGVVWEQDIPAEASPENGWRSRATLHAAQAGQLGFFERGSHRVVANPGCGQLAPGLEEIVAELRARFPKWLGPRGIREVALAGDVEDARHVVELRAAASLMPRLRRALAQGPLKTSQGVGISESRPDARYQRLAGDARLVHRVAGLELQAHLRSFFQSNRFLTGRLVDAVLEAVPERGSVVDLFAGVGLFSLALAARGQRVTAIEAYGLAAADARGNAERHGLHDCVVVRADAEVGLGALPPGDADTVLLDPPRVGPGAGLIDGLVRRAAPRIVYVSCDPAVLARDLARLIGGGYRLESLRVLDMFPTTAHVETLAQLTLG